MQGPLDFPTYDFVYSALMFIKQDGEENPEIKNLTDVITECIEKTFNVHPKYDIRVCRDAVCLASDVKWDPSKQPPSAELFQGFFKKEMACAHTHPLRGAAPDMTAMRNVTMKLKSVLACMRLPLRKAKRELEKTTEETSESHKNMKKFMFKSPMLYETHSCSRKSRVDINRKESDKGEGSGNDENNVRNFLTIDSVGDVNDEEDSKKKDNEGKPKEHVNLVLEQIKKVEVRYCELCRLFYHSEGELEKTHAQHCKGREKNKIKEDQKTTEDDPSKNAEASKNEEEKEKTSGDEENIMGDKLCSDDVNKDLDQLLAEAESGNMGSDEDEDSHANGERYDSKKTGDDKNEEEAKEDAAENMVPENKPEEN